jgi:hypothetical protein
VHNGTDPVVLLLENISEEKFRELKEEEENEA